MKGRESRATFLSIKSLAGRVLFAASLWTASLSASDIGGLPMQEVQTILWWYAMFGVVFLLLLLATVGRVGLDAKPKSGQETQA